MRAAGIDVPHRVTFMRRTWAMVWGPTYITQSRSQGTTVEVYCHPRKGRWFYRIAASRWTHYSPISEGGFATFDGAASAALLKLDELRREK